MGDGIVGLSPGDTAVKLPCCAEPVKLAARTLRSVRRRGLRPHVGVRCTCPEGHVYRVVPTK